LCSVGVGPCGEKEFSVNPVFTGGLVIGGFILNGEGGTPGAGVAVGFAVGDVIGCGGLLPIKLKILSECHAAFVDSQAPKRLRQLCPEPSLGHKKVGINAGLIYRAIADERFHGARKSKSNAPLQ